MTTLRAAFIAAIRSLLRGKSFIQAMLAFWINPTAIHGQKLDEPATPPAHGSLEDFLCETERLLGSPTQAGRLKQLSAQLKAQFREALRSNPACMLPSYNHQLPNGRERGQYLVLDVGGSTLRVAFVELRSRAAPRGTESRIVRIDTIKITSTVKKLVGTEFFDWVADRVLDTVSKVPGQDYLCPENPLPVGLAWSFPIEQTSLKGGKLHGMGKGFMAAEGLLGYDLGDLLQDACRRRGFFVELAAIVNDSTATLLSQAYVSSSTRFSLILGTGVNIAAHLPVPTICQDKYGRRPDDWFDKASHVVVNTELGMFGKGVLPLTRWDHQLQAEHPRPDFQPLEHLVSGFYLGEVCRHVLVEAIDSIGIFGGVLPPSLEQAYSLDTETLSLIEADTSPSLKAAIATFSARHPSSVKPTISDMVALRTICSHISRRSASIVAASLFALWELKVESESDFLRELQSRGQDHFTRAAAAELELKRTLVSFNGSVIEHYPGYLPTCQQFIDELITSVGGTPGALDLVAAKESSLLGAAVALACLDEGGAN